jgi:hypothetical protein
MGRHIEIIQKRKEVKNKTLEARKGYNRTARKREHGFQSVHFFDGLIVLLSLNTYNVDMTSINFPGTLEEIDKKVKSYKICFSNLTAELLKV